MRVASENGSSSKAPVAALIAPLPRATLPSQVTVASRWTRGTLEAYASGRALCGDERAETLVLLRTRGTTGQVRTEARHRSIRVGADELEPHIAVELREARFAFDLRLGRAEESRERLLQVHQTSSSSGDRAARRRKTLTLASSAAHEITPLFPPPSVPGCAGRPPEDIRAPRARSAHAGRSGDRARGAVPAAVRIPRRPAGHAATKSRSPAARRSLRATRMPSPRNANARRVSVSAPSSSPKSHRAMS